MQGSGADGRWILSRPYPEPARDRVRAASVREVPEQHPILPDPITSRHRLCVQAPVCVEWLPGASRASQPEVAMPGRQVFTPPDPPNSPHRGHLPRRGARTALPALPPYPVRILGQRGISVLPSLKGAAIPRKLLSDRK